MSKRKKKLVCVGWGIWLKKKGKLWQRCGGKGVRTDREGAVWEYSCGLSDYFSFDSRRYERDRRKGLVIAKKLWMEE